MKLIRYEWLLVRRNTTLWSVVATLLILIAGATFNGTLRHDRLNEITQSLNDAEEATKAALKAAVSRWESDPVGDPPAVTSPGAVGVSILGHYTVLPPRPLAPLSIGQSDIHPHYFRVNGRSAHTFMEKTEKQNPLNIMSGSFDVSFVIIFLLPVFIIAMTFDLLSKEKERGVLGLILAHGVPLRQIVLAKSLVIAIVVFLAVLLAGFVSLYLSNADFSSVAVWRDFLLWLFIVGVYGFFWFALALLINSFNLPSVTNGVILANLWLIFVIVIPAFVNVAATILYPAPSRVELTTEMREASSLAEEDAAQAREAFFFDHPEMTDSGGQSEAFFVQVLSTDSAVEKSVEHLVEAFDQQAEKRDEIVSWLQFLSPAMLAQESLSTVSGTDAFRFRDFSDQTLAFHQAWRDFFSPRIVEGRLLTSEDFDQIPVFNYNELSTGGEMIRLGRLTAGMIAMLVIVFFWSVRRFRFYPVVERR